jgi:hypothetical protein
MKMNRVMFTGVPGESNSAEKTARPSWLGEHGDLFPAQPADAARAAVDGRRP